MGNETYMREEARGVWLPTTFEAVLNYCKATRGEPGCLKYAFSVDVTDPGSRTVGPGATDDCE